MKINKKGENMKSKSILFNIVKFLIALGSIIGVMYFDRKALLKEKIIKERYMDYYKLMNRWIQNKLNNWEIKNFFDNNNLHSVAIYGMGTLGELIYKELKNNGIKTKYFIEKNYIDNIIGIENIPIISIHDVKQLKNIDLIIVTPIFDYKEIEAELKQYLNNISIVSLEYIINTCT